MKFVRRVKSEVEINLTPLIDVVFLLLIFFMVSTTFTKESHLSIDLPEASAAPVEVAPRQVEISITRRGQYAINEVALVNDSLDTLMRAIEKVSAGDNSIPLIITADAATTHQSVVRAMDAAAQLGFVHLSITTQHSDEEE